MVAARGRVKACLAILIVLGAVQYVRKLLEIAAVLSEDVDASHGFLLVGDSFFQNGNGAIEKTKLGPIFYNVYIPEENKTKQENAFRIIREQMEQRKLSDPKSSVFYTLIGSPNNITDEFCNPNCQQLAHYPTGDEVNTLQALWDYCQSHPTELVTYIHDKGSFHHTEHNEKTRRTATKAALDCRTEMAKQHGFSPYNVCTGTRNNTGYEEYNKNSHARTSPRKLTNPHFINYPF
jgi:hypothetical protein